MTAIGELESAAWQVLLGIGPDETRHLPGQHNQESHGNGVGVDVIPGDKLKLARRAPAGFSVRSSTKLKTDYADVGIAEVDGPDGPHFRIGVITSESGRWDAGFIGEQRKAELRHQLARKRALFDSEDDAVDDDIEDQISELESELEELDNERTAIVSPEAMADFRRQLSEVLEVAKANKVKQDAAVKEIDAIDEKRHALIAEFSDPDLERKISDLSYKLRSKRKIIKGLESGTNPSHWSPEYITELIEMHKADVPELEAKLAPLVARRADLVPPDVLARLEELDRQSQAINDADIDDMLTAAEVSTPSGTRVRAEIWGSDDIDEQWVSTRLYVLAPGETAEDVDEEYSWFRGLKGLNKLIAALGDSSGDEPEPRSLRHSLAGHPLRGLPGTYDEEAGVHEDDPGKGSTKPQRTRPARIARSKTRAATGGRSSGHLGLCTRAFDFELDGPGDGRTLEGYAAVFNAPARIRDLQGDFDEVILPGAFTRSIQRRTPVLQWDHGKDPRIGTAPIGDLEEVREDDHGLYVRARLYDHPDIERVRLAIKGKSVRGMSFRFGVPGGGDKWSRRSGDVDLREIREADTYELGPVVFPAYDATSVSVRSILSGLDAAQMRELVHELAQYLNGAVDLSDFTGRPGTRGAGGGVSDLQPSSGGRSTSIETLRLDEQALHALGVL